MATEIFPRDDTDFEPTFHATDKFGDTISIASTISGGLNIFMRDSGGTAEVLLSDEQASQLRRFLCRLV